MTSILNIAPRKILSSAGLISALLIIAASLPAQEQPAEPRDSAATKDSLAADSREQLRQQLPPGFMDSASTILPVIAADRRKSPGGALLRSLALPGWGQFYTGHKIRGTVTAIAETAFLAGMALEFRDRADLRDKLGDLEKNNGPQWPVDDLERVLLNRRIKNAQQKGGDYLAYGATALLLGMLDSYVSAHLHNFDRHFALAPSGRSHLALTYRF